jgi:hypothetical protein
MDGMMIVIEPICEKPQAPSTVAVYQFDATTVLSEQIERLQADNAALRTTLDRMETRYSRSWEHLPDEAGMLSETPYGIVLVHRPTGQEFSCEHADPFSGMVKAALKMPPGWREDAEFRMTADRYRELDQEAKDVWEYEQTIVPVGGGAPETKFRGIPIEIVP